MMGSTTFWRALLVLLPFALAAGWVRAEAGEFAQSLRELGVRLEDGAGIDRNLAAAYRAHCIAATLGDGEAAYHLGWMYLNGRGVAEDLARAVGWFRRAAADGDPHGQRLSAHFDAVEPAADPDCPLVEPGEPVKRAQIQRWVRYLAPFYGLDPRLVMAVVAAESNFDTRAHSAKDARGLMQLLPATARRFGVADEWHPVQNLLGGMAYLRWLLDRYEGDVPLALAGYNAGEEAVDRYSGVPPYRETRGYVKRIQHDFGRSKHLPEPLYGWLPPIQG